ncbi:MAG: CRISPR-associated endonuclease Cas2 [Anaerolineales bacterium]|nr:CRISPR-associated endonuclease Cas2 [Anaerolineales bacterium]
MRVLLVYDIPHDATRAKVADFCLDYGLDRIQYSAFTGDLARAHQEELMLRIGDRLGDRPGNVQLFAICEKDWRQRLEIIQEETDDVHSGKGGDK